MKISCVRVVFGYIISSLFMFQSTRSTAETQHDLLDKIDAFVNEIVDCYSAPGLSLAVVKDGRTIITRGYGYTSSKKNIQTTSQTKFAIGSLTKAFTSLLAVKAVTELQNSGSNISLDTPISQYMIDYRICDDTRSSQSTLRDLLSHRMSIPGYQLPLIMGFDPSLTRRNFIRRMAFMQTPLSFRDVFIYNNYMYVLAAQVVEHLMNGQSWEDLVRDVIFSPLGMENSGFVTEETEFDNFGLPCYKSNDSLIDLPPDLFNTAYPFGPAGTIYSTAEDMAQWMNLMLSNGQRSNPPGLGPDVTSLTFQAGSLSSLPFIPLAKPEFPVSHQVLHYGLGWLTTLYRGYKQIYHTGGIVTHSSRLWLFPDLDSGIFLSVRGPQSQKRDMLQSILYYVSDLLIGEATWFNASTACQDPVPWKSANKTEEGEADGEGDKFPTTDELPSKPEEITRSMIDNQYVGNYSHPFFGNVRIYTDCAEGEVCFLYGRYGWMSLVPASKTIFHGRFYGPLSYMNPEEGSVIDIVFSLDKSGYAKSLTLESFLDKDVIHFERQQLNVSPIVDRNGQASLQRGRPPLILIFIALYSVAVFSKHVM